MYRDYLLFLEDMRKAGRAVLDYTAGLSADDFRDDQKTIDAVIRNLTIIGEAAKQIPQTVRDQYPELDWRRIGRFRDVAVHHYFAVNAETVWQIVSVHVPTLVERLGEPSSGVDGEDAPAPSADPEA
jgi:uncharacterized protein with HEPN domain